MPSATPSCSRATYTDHTRFVAHGDATTAIPDVGTNPWLKFYSNRRGYIRATVSPTQLNADFRAVAKVSEHGAAASTLKSFVVQEGQPGLQAV